jgi:hypothetical protein
MRKGGGCSFLKKSVSPPQTKKLLVLGAMGGAAATAHGPAHQSFFASFCSQKEALPSSMLGLLHE